MSDDTSGHASIKDVYELVDRTRVESGDKIDALGTKFDSFVTSNEHRLTRIEIRQDAHDQQFATVLNRLDSHGREIGSLKDQQQRDEAADRAVNDANSAKWTFREKLIGVAASAVLAAAAIISLLLTH